MNCYFIKRYFAGLEDSYFGQVEGGVFRVIGFKLRDDAIRVQDRLSVSFCEQTEPHVVMNKSGWFPPNALFVDTASGLRDIIGNLPQHPATYWTSKPKAKLDRIYDPSTDSYVDTEDVEDEVNDDDF